MESLAEKLKSLGVKIGAQDIQPPQRKVEQYPIEEVMPGYEDPTPLGSTWVVQHDYTPDYQHGAILIGREYPLGFLGEWCGFEGIRDIAHHEYLFLDTETSGLSGGTGTYAFMIGLGFRTQAGFRLMQLFMRDPSQEAALLASLSRILAPFKVVVTFNGRGFDIPLLKTRHIINGIPQPFDNLLHIDLLPVARKLWRNRLPSRALKSLEVEILGVPRTSDEVPGYLIPEMYFEYLRSGDARQMSGVFYHNGMDILSLAALFNFINELLANPFASQNIDSLDLMAIARMHEDQGNIDHAMRLYERAISQGLPRPFFIQTLQRFAQLYRRRGDWDSAIQLWEKSVLEYQQLDACIELAKYYEHRQRDPITAMYWTEKALELIESADLIQSAKRSATSEFEHRRDRLYRKTIKNAL